MRGLFVIAPLLLAASPLPGLEWAEKAPALAEEEYAVLRAVIVSSFGDDESKVPPLVMEQLIPRSTQGGLGLEAAEAEMPDLETTTVDTFVARNAAGGRLEDRFRLPRPVTFSPDTLLLQEFLKTTPGVSWPGNFSRVGINHDHTQAIVSDGANVLELLKKEGRWKIVQRVRVVQGEY